ncbi:hypothetical protein [Bacillus sp. Marseille-P3661]|uniref:hypothetical protein n=1 Tax=Bacillus sp. Marseille-P3661 TaxID=1936234 RepID=UPI0015E1634E|nr:hypothetical protein [Bacillus sp. Marseille-P3661]
MTKKSKSKRFYQQSADAIKLHSEKIPYHLTFAEAEERGRKQDSNQPLGGF